MAIKLSNEDALIIRIADAISSSSVIYGSSLSLSETVSLSRDIEINEDNSEKIHRYCGDGGLRSFVRSEVSAILSENYDFESSSNKKALKELSEFSDPVALARKIVSRLKSLPNRYRVTVPLPIEFSKPLIPFLSSVRISDNIGICKSSKLPDDFPMHSDNERIDKALFSNPFDDEIDEIRDLRTENLYLASIELGYCSIHNTATISGEFQDKIRAIYGAGFALGLFNDSYREKIEKKPFIIIHAESDNRPIIATEEINSDIWDGRFRRGTGKFIENSADPFGSIRSIFEKIGIAFGNDEFSRRTMTACIWFFRAKINRNPVDSLLQSTIAMEVLLGDRETSDSIGIAKLLGNRCAYLLGRSRSSRQKIIDEFMDIYRLRSAIVHVGKHRFDRKDRAANEACLRLCGSVIAKELELHHAGDTNTALV